MNDRFSMYDLTSGFRNQLASRQAPAPDASPDLANTASSAPRQPGSLPDYTGPAVTGGLAPHPQQPDPLLAQSFLPDYQGLAPQTTANYANAPSAPVYANAQQPVNPPPDEQKWSNGVVADRGARANVLGQQRVNAVNPAPPQSNVARGVAPQGSSSQAERVRRPLPPLPNHDAPSADGVDRIITEKRNSKDPLGKNERSLTRVPDRATFEGRIIMQKASDVMILRSTAEADQRSETLIHLPESATKQLRADANSRKLLDASMTYGTDGKPLAVSYDKGKWSVAHAPDGPSRSHG